MKVIGITGTIGSGKSTLASFLHEFGAVVIDADKVGHEVYLPGTEGWQKVVAAFGRGILSSDGRIDRKKLGAIVFNDKAERDRLNHIVHPLIIRHIEDMLKKYRRQGVSLVAIEAALLIEAGWGKKVDEVWVTRAPQEVILKRLAAKRKLTRAQALARIRSQLPVREQIKHATRVIDASGSLAELKARVDLLWQKLNK